MYRKPFVPLAVALTAAALTATAPPATARAEIVVSPGHSIQSALNRARPGATVVVRAGHYRESLTITKSVTLRAHRGVVLTPPAQAPQNACTLDPDAGGAMPGICIVGRLVDPHQEDSPLAATVRNVHVSGTDIHGFENAAVEVYGARHVTIDGLRAHDNRGGGIFVSHSRDVTIDRLRARHNGARGVDMQEKVSGFAVRHSTISGNHGDGIFVGDSNHGVITRNHVTRNCTGILLVDLAIPGEQGVGRIRVTHNTVDANNRFCAGDDEGAPSESGNGIVLVGAQHSTVRHNRVRHNVATRAQVGFGGIALLDAGRLTGGAAPVGNRIDHNVIRDNAPRNLTYDGSGHGNTFGHNRVSG
jgi:nitrous oxidase accessory protein NosD